MRSGSRISPLMMEPSSNPPKAKAIWDQKFRLLQFHSGMMWMGVAPRWRKQTTSPARMMVAPARHVARAPRFWVHLPTWRPTRFVMRAIQRAASEIETTREWLSASAWLPGNSE